MHFHDERGKHVYADCPCLRGCGCVNRLHQVEVERTPNRESLRKNGCAGKHRAMRALFILQKRYFQARLGECDLLQLIEVLRLLAGVFVQNLIGQREETAAWPDFAGVGAGCESFASLRLRWDVLPQLIHVDARQIELADFLLERHAAHQVIDAFFDGPFRIQVDRHIGAGLREKRRRAEQRRERHCGQPRE